MWHQFATFLASYPDMVTATLALGLMVVIAGTSVYSIRRRMRRERWWAVHLFMYLALALAFAHEIALGPSFVGHPMTRLIWSLAWASTAGVVLVYRFGLPAWRSLYHRRGRGGRRGGAETVSVVCRGPHLERLAVAGGNSSSGASSQGKRGGGAPFSLSARPRPPFLRLTVKGVGDYSSAVAQPHLGTRS